MIGAFKVLAVGVLLLAGEMAMAGEMVIPGQPGPREFGEFRGYVDMQSTTVVRLSGGETVVTYGFIFGNTKRDGLFFSTNDKLGIICKGETRRQKDKSGVGSLSCSQNGSVISRSALAIPKGIYGKMKGYAEGEVLSPQGKKIGLYRTEWTGSHFPDPAKVLEALK